MPTCVPVSEVKDTAAFVRRVKNAGEPVIVTKNGYEEFIAIDPEVFKGYRKETAEEKLERLLNEADLDVALGRISDACADMDEIRRAYGL